MSDPGVPVIATDRRAQNKAAVDPWTAVHFAVGLAAGLMRLPRGPVLAAAIAYEVVEQVVERKRWGQELFETRGPESPVNAVMDTLVFATGHALGRRWLES